MFGQNRPSSFEDLEVVMHSPLNGIRVLGIVSLLLAVSLPMSSQTTTGRILGTVRDQTAMPIPAATVTVTDVQRGITRTVATDDSGGYVVPNLRSEARRVGKDRTFPCPL